MECKANFNRICQEGSKVLIETLWNVKIDMMGFKIYRDHVLIETLWNVKGYFPVSFHDDGIGINRNIVECKERCSIKALQGSREY